MKKIIILICASMTLFGCELLDPLTKMSSNSGGDLAVSKAVRYTPVTREVIEPPANEKHKVAVGETMISQLLLRNTHAIILKTPIDVGEYHLRPGVYEKVGETSNGSFYSNTPVFVDSGKMDSANIIRSSSQKVVSGLYTSKLTKNELCVVDNKNNMQCAANIKFEERKNISILSRTTKQQHLVYLGKSGNKIKVGYRQYVDNVLQTSFSENIDYDLAETDIIVYKKARIRVSRVTNQDIQYRILSGF